MKRSELVAKVNEQLWEGLYLYADMEEEFDEAIDEMNAELNSTYPAFGDVMTTDESTYSRLVDGVDTPYIPVKYIRNFVVPFVVAAIFRREAEFGNEYYSAKEKYEKWLGNMFRDFYTQIPVEFQEVEAGAIQVQRNAMDVEVDDTEAILNPINPLDQ